MCQSLTGADTTYFPPAFEGAKERRVCESVCKNVSFYIAYMSVCCISCSLGIYVVLFVPSVCRPIFSCIRMVVLLYIHF